MTRRTFLPLGLAGLAAGATASGCRSFSGGSTPESAATASADAEFWRALETRSGGRLGVAVWDTDRAADRKIHGWRVDERFPLCSSFKWVLAAAVLARVEAGQENLERRLVVSRQDLVPHAPVTGSRLGAPGISIGELCEATVTVSDNPAANLLLQTLGGPAGFTAFCRSQGDKISRLDRWEVVMSESVPGDQRDTTTPRAMAGLLHRIALGQVLQPASRDLLLSWMRATTTNRNRLAANLPAGWAVASKTGTGGFGTTNDVGIFWPPGGRPPIIVAAYLTQTEAAFPEREGILASVAQRVTASWSAAASA